MIEYYPTEEGFIVSVDIGSMEYNFMVMDPDKSVIKYAYHRDPEITKAWKREGSGDNVEIKITSQESIWNYFNEIIAKDSSLN